MVVAITQVNLFLYFLDQDDSYLESYISTIGVDFVSHCPFHFGPFTDLIYSHVPVANFYITYVIQKIRTVEQDGKTIKLQIVCFPLIFYIFYFRYLLFRYRCLFSLCWPLLEAFIHGELQYLARKVLLFRHEIFFDFLEGLWFNTSAGCFECTF